MQIKNGTHLCFGLVLALGCGSSVKESVGHANESATNLDASVASDAGDTTPRRLDPNAENTKEDDEQTAGIGGTPGIAVSMPKQKPAAPTAGSGGDAPTASGAAGAQGSKPESAEAGAGGAHSNNAAGADSPVPNESDWKTLRSKCGYELDAPSDVVDKMANGIDSCLSRYEGGGCMYLGDSGAYSNPLDQLSNEANYKIEMVTVDGNAGSLVTAGPRSGMNPYFAGVHFPMLTGAPRTRLTFSANCASEEARDVAVRVINTLRF